ncbi:MAG: hypothetical protein ABI051_18345 [Vicinamibacterales bacterium]
MNQRTRYFLVGSALIVVVGLCTGVVAYYSGALPARRGGGVAEFAYLPADASTIAYADVQDIMNSGFRQKLHELFPAGQEKERMAAETGIDIERDIDTVVASMSGAGRERTLVLLRGRFDAARIEGLVTQHGGTAADYQGTRVLTLSPSVAPAEPSAGPLTNLSTQTSGLAFLEPTLLALGPVELLQRAVDNARVHQDVTGNTELMKFLASVPHTGNAWLVSRLDAATSAANVPDVVRAQLPHVQWFAVSADVGAGVSGVIRAQAIDAAAGDQLRTVVNGALAAARMFGGADPNLQMTLSSLQASGSGPTVEVSFNLTPEMFEQMQRMHSPAAAQGFGPLPVDPPHANQPAPAPTIH